MIFPYGIPTFVEFMTMIQSQFIRSVKNVHFK